jgi:hypothetical protein
MSNYKVIDDERVIEFYKSCTDKHFKKITGIKFPIFGKNKGKMLVPDGLWGYISGVYLANGGYLLPKGHKITAKYLTEED